jgi:hypothetical protein
MNPSERQPVDQGDGVREVKPFSFDSTDAKYDFRMMPEREPEEVIAPKDSSAPESVPSSESPESPVQTITENDSPVVVPSTSVPVSIPTPLPTPSENPGPTADAEKATTPLKDPETSSPDGSQSKSPGLPTPPVVTPDPAPVTSPTSSSRREGKRN